MSLQISGNLTKNTLLRSGLLSKNICCFYSSTFLGKSTEFLLSLHLSHYGHTDLFLFYCNLYWTVHFYILLLQSSLSLRFPIAIFTFFLLFNLNLYFLFTFLLHSLLSLRFSLEITTFSFLFSFWKHYWLSLSSIEIGSFASLFYRNLEFSGPSTSKSFENETSRQVHFLSHDNGQQR